MVLLFLIFWAFPAFSVEVDRGSRDMTVTRRVPIRLKEIVQLQGIRSNFLVGYGLVVGLNGSGDTPAGSPYTQESLISMLERSGINIRDKASNLSGKSVAAVMVTATLPSFARTGSRLDVTVSVLGDAKDLRGGTLVVTPLLGADGEVHAVAQGMLAVSGISAQGKLAGITRGVPTSAKILHGAIIEKEVGFELKDLSDLRLILNHPDFTTARRIVDVIEKKFSNQGISAKALDSSTIQLRFPMVKPDLPIFLNEMEQLTVEPDNKAQVVIDQNGGVIVVTDSVRLEPAAVIHGTITVKIKETPPNVSTTPFPGPQFAPTGNTLISTVSKTSSTTDIINRQKAEVDLLNTQQMSDTTAFQDQQRKDLKNYETANPNSPGKERDLFIEEQAIANDKFLLDQRRQKEQLLDGHRQQLVVLQQQDQLSRNTNALNALNLSNQNQLGILNQEGGDTKVDVKEKKGKFKIIAGANLEELVNALNALGAGPEDISTILQNLKISGSLHAEVLRI